MDVIAIAYRGASHVAPENTLPAIHKAVEAGCGMICLDVQRTQDNQPAVIANVSADRTTNGSGKIAKLNLAELQSFDAGAWFNAEFAGAKVPSLAEAAAAAGSTPLLLLLPECAAGSAFLASLQKALAGRAAAHDVLVLPDSDSLKAVRDALPDFHYALALSEKTDGWVHVEKAEKLGLKAVRLFRIHASKDVVQKAHARGIKVYAHFANEESEMRPLVEARVDGIVTARPERLKHVLKGLAR